MVLSNILCNLRLLKHVQTQQTIRLSVIRTYSRWVSRRPVAIVNENELYECEDTTQKEQVPRKRARRRITQSKQPEKKKESEKKTAKEERKEKFTKLKETDKIVTSLMTKLRSRKKREKSNEVILEGHRLIKDALKAGLTPSAILFNDQSDIEELQLPTGITLYKVPYKTIQLWSSLTTSPGLLGIFKTPEVEKNAPANNALPLTIVCDNIREPGNLGSIMRVAAGVGCEKLIITKGCVDLWEPKVLRSAAGTHFRLPIHVSPTWDEIPSLISEDCNIFVADSNFGDQYVQFYSSDMLESSLEIFDKDPEELKLKLCFDTEKNTELTVTNMKMKEFLLKFPIMPYYSLDYTRKESVIILSGETEGLSLDCSKFLNERKGIRIHIPLVSEVDSLNAGVALGIVMFEIKRQFLKKQSML